MTLLLRFVAGVLLLGGCLGVILAVWVCRFEDEMRKRREISLTPPPPRRDATHHELVHIDRQIGWPPPSGPAAQARAEVELLEQLYRMPAARR